MVEAQPEGEPVIYANEFLKENRAWRGKPLLFICKLSWDIAAQRYFSYMKICIFMSKEQSGGIIYVLMLPHVSRRFSEETQSN